MKIGTKLTLWMTLPLVVIVVLFGYLSLRRSRALLQEELRREGRSIARVTQMAMEDYVRDRQIEDARELVDKITGYERVLGARLFDSDGRLIYQSSTLEAIPALEVAVLREVLSTRTPAQMSTRLHEEQLVHYILPLSTEKGEPLGAVQVLQREPFLEEAASSLRQSIVLLTAAMVLATCAVILLVTRYSVSRPIEELVRSLRGVGSGGFESRVSVRRGDEFGRLAQEFNSMCERLERAQESLLAEQEERRRVESRLRNAERLASLGRLAAGLAHEIGNPLHVIGGRAEALLRKLKGTEPAEKALRIIVSQIDRIARIVRGMLDFARAREPHLAPVDLSVEIQRVLDLLEHRLEECRVSVALSLPDPLPPVVADADQLHQVFLNLATNAVDAMPDGGTLSIRVLCVSGGDGEQERPCLAIEFDDTGAGIAPEHLTRIFDPFFTTKDVGKGTGLGLSVSYGIVREHGGWIDALSEPGHGVRVRVHLPLTGARPPLAPPGAGPRAPRVAEAI